MSAHVDIVPEGNPTAWSYPPFGASIDAEQRLYGRGSMDGKAGAAIVLAVLETLLEMRFRLDGDLLCYFVIEDETTGNGSLLCLDNGYLPDAAVIIDGTRGDRAIDRHAGQIQFALYVQGKAASVCVSHLGVNAADLLARLVARLADAVVALNATRTGDWLRYPSPFQLVTQRLASEGAQLTVPEMAQATCYMTFPPPWTIGRTLTFLDAEVAAFAARHQLSDPPCMRVLFRAEPVASEASEMVGVLRRSAVDAGFGSVETSPSTGTSDLRHFVARGIPCVLYGPGGGANPHRPDEYYDLGDLPRMVRLFVDFASRWCGTAA
ncbi:MAG: M20 family metallopeptidase [Bryobacteraceae bacterium]